MAIVSRMPQRTCQMNSATTAADRLRRTIATIERELIMISVSRHLCTCLMTAAVFVLPWPSIAQERVKPPSQEEIAKYRELAKPGPEHEMLSKFAGKWDVTVSAGRRAASTGGGRSYMTMERRFLWIGYEAEGRSGRYKGAFTIGFDRRHQHYTLIAMDTDGTYFITSRGKKLPDSKKIKLLGSDDDPYMEKLGFKKEFAHVLDFSDPDKFTIDVLYLDTRTKQRKEMKAIEFTFTRKAGPDDK